MKRSPVVSSNVASVGYDAAAQTLEVGFNSGAVYQYFGVPVGVYSALMAASSVGGYLAQHIKGKYRYKQL